MLKGSMFNETAVLRMLAAGSNRDASESVVATRKPDEATHRMCQSIPSAVEVLVILNLPRPWRRQVKDLGDSSRLRLSSTGPIL